MRRRSYLLIYKFFRSVWFKLVHHTGYTRLATDQLFTLQEFNTISLNVLPSTADLLVENIFTDSHFIAFGWKIQIRSITFFLIHLEGVAFPQYSGLDDYDGIILAHSNDLRLFM